MVVVCQDWKAFAYCSSETPNVGNKAEFCFLPAVSCCHGARPLSVGVSSAIPREANLTDLIQIAFWMAGSLDNRQLKAINKSAEKICSWVRCWFPCSCYWDALVVDVGIPTTQ